jgi:hypothetical protein
VQGAFSSSIFDSFDATPARLPSTPNSDKSNAIDTPPWFVKEADKNLGGEGIGICRDTSGIMELLKPSGTYVVQQHIRCPLLTDDGRKAHLKFYCLLVTGADGVRYSGHIR